MSMFTPPKSQQCSTTASPTARGWMRIEEETGEPTTGIYVTFPKAPREAPGNGACSPPGAVPLGWGHNSIALYHLRVSSWPRPLANHP